MSDPYATKLKELEKRIKALEGLETPGYTPVTAYTPTYLGGTSAGVTTYTTQSGFYLTIGSLVLAWGQVVWTAATGTGNAQISLPFIPSVTSTLGNVRSSNVTFAAGAPEIVTLTSAAAFQLRSPTTNAVTTAIAIEAAGDLIYAVAYPTS